jgi:hypothetical protein
MPMPPPTTTVPPPTISAISPQEGPGDTTVTITGTGFSATMALDSVFFNRKRAAITSATSTQLVVTVPALAGTGVVSIAVNGDSVTGPSFTYDYRYAVTALAGNAINKYGSADGTGSAASLVGLMVLR